MTFEFIRGIILDDMDTIKSRQSVIRHSSLITPDIYKSLVKLCNRYHIVYMGIFGSFARGESAPDSDVDILVKFAEDKKITLFDLVEIEDELKSIFNRDVDIVTENSLSPYLKDEILGSVKVIYEG